MNRKIKWFHISRKSHTYWTMNVSSKQEVYKAICKKAQLPISCSGEKGREIAKAWREKCIKGQRLPRAGNRNSKIRKWKKKNICVLVFVFHKAAVLNSSSFLHWTITAFPVHSPHCVSMNETLCTHQQWPRDGIRLPFPNSISIPPFSQLCAWASF